MKPTFWMTAQETEDELKRRRIPVESETFDTSTVEGIQQAERYKAKLENIYDHVSTVPVGLYRVRIEGRR